MAVEDKKKWMKMTINLLIEDDTYKEKAEL